MLDVGTGHPYPFQILISGLGKNCTFVVAQERMGNSLPYQRFVSKDKERELSLTVAGYNVEIARWPFQDATFDVIL